MELELSHLDRKYASLRVLATDRLGPLLSSLAEAGQQTPVLVVALGSKPVLIDGYRRVAAVIPRTPPSGAPPFFPDRASAVA